MTAAPLPDGGFVRRMPGSDEIDLVVPRDAGCRASGTADSLRASDPRASGPTRRTGWPRVRPRLGVDTDERTIPHEVGWIGGPGDGAVHLDKGCYRGQETVARVHNLGKPPRMLVLLHLDGSADRPATGDPVLAGGRAGRPARHRRRPRRPRPDRAGAAEARAPADTAADHRRRRRGGRGHRRRFAAGHRRGGRWAARRRPAARRQPVNATRRGRACQHAAAGHGKVLAGQ